VLFCVICVSVRIVSYCGTTATGKTLFAAQVNNNNNDNELLYTRLDGAASKSTHIFMVTDVTISGLIKILKLIHGLRYICVHCTMKVKLSLCSLNQWLSHEDVRGSEGVDPRHLFGVFRYLMTVRNTAHVL
jgi:hypothetical protein